MKGKILEPTKTTHTEGAETFTPFRFRIRISDELLGCVKSPKTKEDTLELLHRDLTKNFGEQYEILEFAEISEDEWETAVRESDVDPIGFPDGASRVLN